MRASSRLDSAVFQLTPTRTRCDLVIFANGKTEKIASGLVNPFLAHLKTAQDQMAKGGYSIILEPEQGSDATWFTKDVIERFVRFVSTPEVVERVYTLESEILQIEEAISIQNNGNVEGNLSRPVERIEGNRHTSDNNEEKAIVLYKPGADPPEENGSTAQEGNSKVQLLRVLETRKTVLQKEQGMAFARAVAAGFDIDHMAPLISFAKCFGANRLMDACIRFMELWERKHETGQWLEIDAAEAVFRSDHSAINSTGIMLSNLSNREKEFREALHEPHKVFTASKSGEASIDPSLDDKPHTGHQEYFQGQFPHHMVPPWSAHSPNGAPSVYQAYPMQGMPYYPQYPGSGPYLHPLYPSNDDPRIDTGERMKRRHSLDTRNRATESENGEMDASETRPELLKEDSHSRELQKKASRSSKKRSGMVVIRNINYITPKKMNSSVSESETDSESDIEDEDIGACTPVVQQKSYARSSERKESITKSMDALNFTNKDETAHGIGEDAGHWQAFQNILLRDADEDKCATDQCMYSMEKEYQVRERYGAFGEDPLALSDRDSGETQEGNIADMHNVNGNGPYMQRASHGEILFSQRKALLGDGRSINGEMELQSSELEGRRGGYRRPLIDDFVVYRRENQLGITNSPSDPLAVNRFQSVSSNVTKSSSQKMDDDSYIVPFRSNGADIRNATHIDSEFASQFKVAEVSKTEVKCQVNYEPNNLMPERGEEKGSIGFDPALDYEMPVCAESGRSLNNKSKLTITKADKGQKSKIVQDTSQKKKNVGPIRKGKPSKSSPLEDAKARAEKLRAFKSDLQRIKKEKEEEDIKRLEALKMERQKRIAARCSSSTNESTYSSRQTRRQLPSKLLPSYQKGSKFSDTEPGPLSPLQRFPIKTVSPGSINSQKTCKTSTSNSESRSAGNRLSHSVSSLREPKKENSSGSTPAAKASAARIRRLSEPKLSSNHQASSMKLPGDGPVARRKISLEPENKKISAIISLDRSKAATLPELKIKTPKGPDVSQSKSAAKETIPTANASKSSMISEDPELKKNDDRISHHMETIDNTVIDKTVLMLQCEKPSISSTCELKESTKPELGNSDIHVIGGKSDTVLAYDAIHAPGSPLTVDVVKTTATACSLQPYTCEVVKDIEQKTPKVPQKPYQAPYARLSSLDDQYASNSEHGKAFPANLDEGKTIETVKAHVRDYDHLKLQKIPESLEKPQAKESPKGFRRLLKFGRKNHSSSTREQDVESDTNSGTGVEADDSLRNTGSSIEVHMLKNLILQDETPTASTTSQKSSRHFSLLSPFRNKTVEKKQIT